MALRNSMVLNQEATIWSCMDTPSVASKF